MQRVPLTLHARTRQAQRGLRGPAIAAAINFGREIPAGSGDVFLYLGRNEVLRAAAVGQNLREHEGITLVVLPNGSVKTLWRSARPPRAGTGGCRHPRDRRGRQ